tara:strand:+ start:52 stop:702 length:651 start_codon:yes stop_codon:yes gene_type:complete
MKRNQGFTLVELMISVIIFSAILYGVSRVFIDITDTVRVDRIRLNLSTYVDRAFDKIESDLSKATSIDRNPSYLGADFDVINIINGSNTYIYSFDRKDGIMLRSNTINNGVGVPIYKALGSAIRYDNVFGIQTGDSPVNDCKNNNFIIDKFRIFSKDWNDAMPSSIAEGRGNNEYLLRLKAYLCGTNDEKLEYLQFDRLVFAGNLFIDSQKDDDQY